MDQLDSVAVTEKLRGWNKVVFDHCFKNQLTNVKNINMQTETIFRVNQQSSKDIYLYSAYLPPGHHSLLIYCPKTERAFIKQFYVGLNDNDFYPELPGCINAGQRAKNVQNMWR
jgi:hypothetical protein